VWVVRDTHDSHQDRWVDVAYSIEVPIATQGEHFTAAFVIAECKSGYSNSRSLLSSFCKKFFQKAKSFAHNNFKYYFVATFICEFDFKIDSPETDDLPNNLETVVQVIGDNCCPLIHRFLKAESVIDGTAASLETSVISSQEGLP
jgi:hypothetical protein